MLEPAPRYESFEILTSRVRKEKRFEPTDQNKLTSPSCLQHLTPTIKEAIASTAVQKGVESHFIWVQVCVALHFLPGRLNSHHVGSSAAIVLFPHTIHTLPHNPNNSCKPCKPSICPLLSQKEARKPPNAPLSSHYPFIPSLKELEGLFQHIGPTVGLDHCAVGDDAGRQALLHHLFQQRLGPGDLTTAGAHVQQGVVGGGGELHLLIRSHQFPLFYGSKFTHCTT